MSKKALGFKLVFLPTFIVDPPTMLVLGVVYTYVGGHFLKPRLSGWIKENIVAALCLPTTIGLSQLRRDRLSRSGRSPRAPQSLAQADTPLRSTGVVEQLQPSGY